MYLLFGYCCYYYHCSWFTFISKKTRLRSFSKQLFPKMKEFSAATFQSKFEQHSFLVFSKNKPDSFVNLGYYSFLVNIFNSILLLVILTEKWFVKSRFFAKSSCDKHPSFFWVPGSLAATHKKHLKKKCVWEPLKFVSNILAIRIVVWIGTRQIQTT